MTHTARRSAWCEAPLPHPGVALEAPGASPEVPGVAPEVPGFPGSTRSSLTGLSVWVGEGPHAPCQRQRLLWSSSRQSLRASDRAPEEITGARGRPRYWPQRVQLRVKGTASTTDSGISLHRKTRQIPQLMMSGLL